MALKQPLFFENNTDRQNADEVRLLVKGLLGGVTGETSGVAHPDHFKVTEKSGTPDMSVDVAAGHIFIEGSRNSAQGTYHLYNDATVNVPLSASDPTNPRIDIIYVRLRDSAYDAGFTGDDDAEIVVAEGTPAAVPVAPTITDEDYVELAHVTVGVGVSSIVNANITDLRTNVAAAGGTLPCTSTTRPSNPTEGLRIYETDTDREYIWSGSAWVEVGRLGAWTNFTPAAAQGASLSRTINRARYVRFGRTIHFDMRLTFTSSGVAGNALLVDLPVPAAATGVVCAHGWFNDGGVQYNGIIGVVNTGALTMFFHRADSTAAATIGADPNIAVASGDVLSVAGTYEAASSS